MENQLVWDFGGDSTAQRVQVWDTYDIPTWAVTALEYSDDSSLQQFDIDQIEEFCDGLPDVSWFDWDFAGGEYFSNSPAFGLPSACIKCAVMYQVTDDPDDPGYGGYCDRSE